LTALLLTISQASAPFAAPGIVLGGERVKFDVRLAPRFTPDQIRNTADATRAGLVRWAATRQGRQLIQFFVDNECLITVTEELDDDALGKAPQPGLATLVAASDRSRTKFYKVALNPHTPLPSEKMKALSKQPLTASDLMAAAWAGEMLHVAFYARGISLPHHARADFQDEWRAVAEELGFPGLIHDDELDEREGLRRMLALRYGN
jgi:hypothetical protein